MKKTILCLTFAAFLFPLLKAQEVDPNFGHPLSASVDARHHLELRVGDPFMPALFGGDLFKCDCVEPDYYSPTTAFSSDYSVSTQYTMLPTFSLDYFYAVKPWLEVGATVSYWANMTKYVSQLNGKSEWRGHQDLTVMAAVRFPYFRRPCVNLYSGVEFGLYNSFQKGKDYKDYSALPAFQLTGLGVSFGKQVYGSVELGWGMKGFANAGIGVKF